MFVPFDAQVHVRTPKMQQAGIAGLRYYSLLIVNAPHSHGDSSIEVLQVPPTHWLYSIGHYNYAILV